MSIPCPSPSQILGDPKQTRPTPASHPGELSSPGVARGGTFSVGQGGRGLASLGGDAGAVAPQLPSGACRVCTSGLPRGVAASVVLGCGGQEHLFPSHCEEERTGSSTDRNGIFFF